MKISVIGTGYVGLVTGACFAEKGHNVVCVDMRKEIVDKINKNMPTIHEPGLKELMDKSKDRLHATTDLTAAIMDTEISFICVGTPMNKKGGIDLSQIIDVSKSIGKALKAKNAWHMVVVKSTVVPGTTINIVAKNIADESKLRFPEGFGIGFNPEFLREGNAVVDSLSPDRIVLGTEDDKSLKKLKLLYGDKFEAQLVLTNTRTAEMVKYVNNSLLSTLISFSNEIANICEAVPGVDADEVLQIVTMDSRINPRHEGKLTNPQIITYLRGGCGFGGSCFPKDLKAITEYANKNGADAKLLTEVDNINRQRALTIMTRIEKRIKRFDGKTVTLLGAAFKPDTDDIRESPALHFIELLLKRNAKINITDPEALNNTKRLYGRKLRYFDDPRKALKGADLAILVTRWKVFAEIKPQEFSSLMRTPLLFDGRRMYDKKAYSDHLEYMGVGFQ